jgi:hypothetical protein
MTAATAAYVHGIRDGDMADHGVMFALARRYNIKMFVWMPPVLEALDVARARSTFRPHVIHCEGVAARPACLFIFATNVGCEHFEPIVRMQGFNHLPSRLTAWSSRPEEEGYCPILNVTYTSRGQVRRV